MSKKQKPVQVSLANRKLETIMKQIARIQRSEDTSTFKMKELEAMRDELLVEINE